MYVHFEDWSSPMFVDILDEKGLPHGDKIIKAFATDFDPRDVIDWPRLTVVESSDSPFAKAEAYEYPGRGSYSGDSLELGLEELGLNNFGNRIVRSLFRFSNDQGFCQAAMAANRPDGADWLIDHPFEDIDGIEIAQRNPARTFGIHLDIFFPESVEALRRTVDHDDSETVLDWRQSIPLLRHQRTTN